MLNVLLGVCHPEEELPQRYQCPIPQLLQQLQGFLVQRLPQLLSQHQLLQLLWPLRWSMCGSLWRTQVDDVEETCLGKSTLAGE